MKTNTPKDLQKLNDKTFILTLSVPLADIKQQNDQTLVTLQKTFSLKGFRPGSVPLDVVRREISPEALLEESASKLISRLYSQKVRDYQLRPIVDPQVKILNPPLSLDHDWQIEITSCELPVVTLDPKYLEAIKKINSTTKSDSPEKTDLILNSLASSASLELPPVLLIAETNRRLASLVDQANQAGISVDTYLQSQKLTLDQYRHQLHQQINREWKINLAIDLIGREQKLQPTPEEIEKLTAKSPQLKSQPGLAIYLLTQQKVLDYLSL